MSSIFSKPPSQKPDWTGLGANTSTPTLPVPMVYGRAKVAPNLLWDGDLRASTGGGGKGGGGTGSLSYKMSLVMALCRGPIAGVRAVWRDQAVYSLAQPGLSLFNGDDPQAPWSYLTTNYPDNALSYKTVAYVAAANYGLGSQATIANHNFEIDGTFAGTAFNGIDADPALVIADFLCNPITGCGFPKESVDGSTLFCLGPVLMPLAQGASVDCGSVADPVTAIDDCGQVTMPTVDLDLGAIGGAVTVGVVGSLTASLQSYCRAVGLAISPKLDSQETAQSILQRWFKLLNAAPFWSGGTFKVVPFGDTPLVAGTVVGLKESRQVRKPLQTTPVTPPTIVVCFAKQFVADLGVVYLLSGAPLTEVASNPITGQYSVSGGVYTFNKGDINAEVTIDYSYAIAADYTPNIAPVVDLSDDDFIFPPGDSADDPIPIGLADPYKAYNVLRLEVSERANAYNLLPVEARDQDAVERFGQRIDTSVSAHEICDPTIGAISGQLMLQRGLYIRATYPLKLGWEYCLLDPMDTLSLTQKPRLDHALSRIISIEEGDDGLLDVVAEELPIGVATAAVYQAGSIFNTPIDRSQQPGSVNTPTLFEPPATLVLDRGGSGQQLWIGASGQIGGVADPWWGGAVVWISVDGSSFDPVGEIDAAANQGLLTAAFGAPTTPDPDMINTCAVDLTESGGVVGPSSAIKGSHGLALCLVGSELISYNAEALTGPSQYALTGLYRGLYQTTASAHAIGDPFCVLDSALFVYPLPANLIGKTLFIELQSFNIFKTAYQDRSDCVVYTFTPTGGKGGVDIIMQQLMSGAPVDLGAVTDAATASGDFGAGAGAVTTSFDLGAL